MQRENGNTGMVENRRRLIQTGLISLIIGICVYSIFVFWGNGFFTICDDFNTQQLTFAESIRNVLLSGKFWGWDWQLDLGCSLVNGYSFYNIGSPFYWIYFLFPTGTFPYVAGWLYVIKHVIAGMSSYLFLALFVKNKKWAVIGGLLYSFSGFQTTNLEFHFHDMVAFFPFMLYGLERYLADKKNKVVFIVSVFINCFGNYFFFVQEVIFLVIYYLFRYFSLEKRNIKDFVLKSLSLMGQGIQGIGMASALFIPSIVYITGNSRSNAQVLLYNLVYPTREFLDIVKGILLPGDAMNDMSIITPQNWSSTSAFLPAFGISLVLAYMFNKKEDWIIRLLKICFLTSFSPLLNSGFLLFTGEYQRWWYMFILLMILATILVLESPEEYMVCKGVSTYICAVLVLYICVSFICWDETGITLVYHSARLLLFVLMAVVPPLIMFVLYKIKKLRYRIVLIITCIMCIVTTAITLYYYRDGSNTVEYRKEYNLGLQLETINEQYRYNTTNNVLTLTGEAAGYGAFSSTIENSSREFNELFDLRPGVSTADREFIPGLPLLLAAKYSITTDSAMENIIRELESEGTQYFISERDACPIGFAVNSYITEEKLKAIPIEKRAIALMHAFVIQNEDAWMFQEETAEFNPMLLEEDSALEVGVEKAGKNAVKEFSRDNSGFNCKTDYNDATYVYFTVPYDKGWTAYIDNQEKEIYSSGGMMVLKVPAGECEIRFEYCTYMLKEGIVISAVFWIIFIIRVIVVNYRKKYDKNL